MRRMFGRVSSRYDLMNTLMTFGRDQAWRRLTLRAASLPRGGLLLDVGTGTGRIALEAARQDPDLKVAALDLTPEMLEQGKRSDTGGRILWINGDALDLPFPEGLFDAVTSGYLMRNVPDIHLALKEQLRVVRPGGRVAFLDTSPPRSPVLRPFIRVYFRIVIPLLGGLVSGQWDAYRYLPRSTEAFRSPEELSEIMACAGFTDIRCRSLMLGTMVLMSGARP